MPQPGSFFIFNLDDNYGIGITDLGQNELIIELNLYVRELTSFFSVNSSCGYHVDGSVLNQVDSGGSFIHYHFYHRSCTYHIFCALLAFHSVLASFFVIFLIS